MGKAVVRSTVAVLGATERAAAGVGPPRRSGLLLFDAFFIRGGGRQEESAGFEVDRHDG